MTKNALPLHFLLLHLCKLDCWKLLLCWVYQLKNPQKGWSLLNAPVRPNYQAHAGSIVTASGETFAEAANIVISFDGHFTALYNTLPPAQYSLLNFNRP